MKLTKPEDLKYAYCWHCMGHTALCPHCDGNACACGCTGMLKDEYKGISQEDMPCFKSQFWEAVEFAENNNMVPTEVTEEEINQCLDRMRAYYSGLSPEEKEQNEGFGKGHGLLDESEYWQIANKAKQINMTIPSLEDFGKEVGIKPNYDCKSGLIWNTTTYMDILLPTGWDSEESYRNERIPWIEYVYRKGESECIRDPIRKRKTF